MFFWPWKSQSPSATCIQELDAKARLDESQRAYAISPFLTVSILGWLAQESELAEKAEISEFALQRAAKSVAVTLAKLLVKTVEIPTSHAKFESFIGEHCNHLSFSPEGVPDRFAGQPFLSRATHAEWRALATNFIRPEWLEPALVQWAQSQRLKLKPKVGE
ncbi:hypothetical protein ABH908_000155 [Pseudomonas frederiksbergensis]|uniref:hypothetical protein n=1 Tax=Pseudomonas TaxID=286 RepID=UPI003D2524E7